MEGQFKTEVNLRQDEFAPGGELPQDVRPMAQRAVDEESKRGQQARQRFSDRWYGKGAIVLAGVALLTLALAPAKQFYLAWVGLVPWMLVVRGTRTAARAFWWSWLGGALFFAANLWWLIYVTAPGAAALVIYLGTYWGAAALIIRPWIKAPQPASLEPSALLLRVVGFATIWVALEFVRSMVFTGLPWDYLGHSQSPILFACQIADIFGVYGVSFCIAAVNALVFLYVIGADRRRLRLVTAVVVVMWVASCAYGAWRLAQSQALSGPVLTVAVIQPNYPQDNKGEKGADLQEIVRFHIDQTIRAVESLGGGGGHVDLVAWSETMMPPLNVEYRAASRQHASKDIAGTGRYFDDLYCNLVTLARGLRTNLIVGGMYGAGPFTAVNHKTSSGEYDALVAADRRNSAYLILDDGQSGAPPVDAAIARYDKIHLVPFGEFIPFKHSHTFHWLYSFFNSFSPYDFDYTLTAGSEDAPTVFKTRSAGFVTPICFEDLDAHLVAKMFRGPDGGKRADLIVNLTNDGWFKPGENQQHLQSAIFRSIENRAPTARSVNTGVSAVIDSCGRVIARVPQGTAGAAVATVALDPRYTVYSRWGDWFAWICTTVTVGLAARGLIHWRRTRRARRP
jgi:apolipoprotein N-acyltransferase